MHNIILLYGCVCKVKGLQSPLHNNMCAWLFSTVEIPIALS